MFPMATAAVGNSAGATLVGAMILVPTASSQPVAFPVGTRSEDFALLACWDGFSPGSSGVTGGAGGWSEDTITWTNYGYGSGLHYKKLQAGDLGGVNLSLNGSSPYLVAVYRGAGAVSVKSKVAGQSGNNLTFPGFTRAANCKGLVTIGHDRDASSNPSAPQQFTRRSSGGYGYFSMAIADLLDPGRYNNGDPVEWSDWLSGTDQVGWLLEFT